MIRRSIHRLGRGIAVSLAAVATLAVAPIATADGHDGPSFAVRAGRVMPVSPEHPAVIEDAVIVVRHGRIEAIGADVEPPADLPLVEMPDATIVPGFVAASTSVAGRHSGDRSIAAGHRAVDAFDTYGDNRRTLSAGVTTAHINPGWHRLMTGRGAVVRMAGEPGERVLVAESDLVITLGPGVANPPNIVEFTLPPSPDQEIKPAMPQRPGSRMTQFLALREAISAAPAAGKEPGALHERSLAEAWAGGMPIRVQAQDAVDMAGALVFMESQDRSGYLVGGTDAVNAADRITASGLPLVYTVDAVIGRPGGDVGENPQALERSIADLAAFSNVKHLAISVADGRPVGDLRIAAAMAGRSGLSAERRLAAITRIPAEILGVDDEVGSLRPGRRADMLVLNGDPLSTSTSVRRTYMDGRLVFSAPSSDALVVRAGTIWLGPGEWLEDGEVLVEDGVITEVGRRVGRPPHARVVDAGDDAWVTPGLIDAYGHLGLRGDRSGVSPAFSLEGLIGATDLPEDRTAAAGVTSVMLAPYSAGGGSQMTAVKTAGHSRSDRVIRATAGVTFDTPSDPRSVRGRFAGRLEAAKKYVESWNTYEASLAEWAEKRAAGEATEGKAKIEETEEGGAEADPITGTWEAVLSGGPLPEEQNGVVRFRLDGNSIEGRIIEPDVPAEVRITGTIDGTRLSGEIEVDTGGMGTPTWEGEIVEEDLIRGTAGLAGMIEVEFEMRRTDKTAVEFKVTRTRRTAGKDGRPMPPKTDPALEPLRSVLAGEIPVVVNAADRAVLSAALDTLVGGYEVPVVIRGGNDAAKLADRLVEAGIGVVLPTSVIRADADGLPYHQGRDLDRRGVMIAFQSNAGDGARTLRDVAVAAVANGLSPESALAALTVEPARLFKLHDRIGSIAPGLDGDLVIFDGPPMEAGTSVDRVFVAGEEVRP